MTTANTTTTLTRANKLTVKVNAAGILQADFARTHKAIATITADQTKFQPSEGANRTAIREEFRSYMAKNAAEFGINYDPTDRRTAENTRLATYSDDAAVGTDAATMLTADINKLLAAGNPFNVALLGVEMDSIAAKTHTGKGTDLSTMGIEGGKYLKNGNWAWADLDLFAHFMRDSKPFEVLFQMELVSGQLKKTHLTKTSLTDSLKATMLDAGILTEEEANPTKAKAEKSAKAEGEKIGLGDAEHEGLHWDGTPEEEVRAMHESENWLAKKDGKVLAKYEVTFAVKAGQKRGEEVAETMTVEAENAKVACSMVKELVKATRGINAFRPMAKKVEG